MKQRISNSIREAIAAKEAMLQNQLGLIEKAAAMISQCVKSGNKVLFFGNGGSASDSQHLAAEFVGRYEKERGALPAIALTTDTSILTAVGNDYGFDHVFERQISALAKKGDVAIAISTSGNSKNVVQAVKKAKEMGVYTIGLMGRGGGQMKALVDLPIVIESQKIARIQECHILIGHILCECVDESLSA